MNFFDRLNYAIRNSEASLINLLSAIAPWLAPLAPAYMTYVHLSNDATFNFPEWVALAVALVVEILGLSAVSTTLSFWTHNKRRLAEHKKAPVQAAVLSFAMYLVIIITINVILDGAKLLGIPDAFDIAIIAAKFLLTLLGVPAAIIMGSRAIHTETLSAIASEKEERKQDRAVHKAQVEKATVGRTSTDRDSFLQSVLENRDNVDLNDTDAVVTYIMQNYGKSDRTAFRWLKDARALLEQEES